MKTLLVIITILLSLCSHSFSQDKKHYQYKSIYNKDLNQTTYLPTKYGIQHYVSLNEKNIVKQVQDFLDDSIFSYSITVDDLSQYNDYDDNEAGRFSPDDEIIIHNNSNCTSSNSTSNSNYVFYDYELSFIPKWKRKEFVSNTKFVRGTIIHELLHLYIYQFINTCVGEGIPINTEYLNFSTYPKRSVYGSEFIEEGICEYVVQKLNEGIYSGYKLDCLDGYEPDNINVNKFIRVQNKYSIKYEYSRTYVEKIFENKHSNHHIEKKFSTIDAKTENNFKEILLLILTNKPPSYQELLCPEQYYYRLNRNN